MDSIRKVRVGFPTKLKLVSQHNPFANWGGQKHEKIAKKSDFTPLNDELLCKVVPIKTLQQQSCSCLCFDINTYLQILQ